MIIELLSHLHMIGNWRFYKQYSIDSNNLTLLSFKTTGMVVSQRIILMPAVIKKGDCDDKSHCQGNNIYDTTNGHAKSVWAHTTNIVRQPSC